jgi:Sec-independent protein translocase protein TatA
MFGLGYLEIGVLLLVLILLFGGRRTGTCLGKAFGLYRKVEDTKQDMKRQFSPINLIRTAREDQEKNK